MPGHIASSTAGSKVADPIACSAQTASGPSEGKPAARADAHGAAFTAGRGPA